ncbi:MAG: universal stress protein [Pseudomonadota bacterium]
MLPTLSRLLCAIDLSPNSHVILGHAVAFGRGLGAEVHVLHVEEPPSAIGRAEVAHVLGVEGMRRHEEKVAREQVAQLERCLDAFVADHLPGAAVADVFAAWHVAHDRPARAILLTAERLGAGLLVAGMHGHGALEHLVAGSVAQQLVNKSRVPLVLVPLDADNKT